MNRHAHRDPWDDDRRRHAEYVASIGLSPEAEVSHWEHEHPHDPGHEDVLWLEHKRTPDGEMVA